MNKIFKLFASIAIVSLVFAGCQKEEVEQITPVEKVVTQGENFEPANINGEKLIFKYAKDLRKGVYADHTNGAPWLHINQGLAYVDNSNKTYVTMKVIRSSAPGDYFYIMCENLDIDGRDGHFLAYEYNTTYKNKYGQLYDWDEANNLSSTVYMNLPMVYQNVEYPSYTSRCNGRLPNFSDIKYLLGESSIPSLPDNGTAPSAQPDRMYYDAFVGGLGATNESEYTLVGYANNMDYTPQRFFGMQKYTKMWTSVETTSQNEAYPLSIQKEDEDGNIYDYVAYINVAHAKRYAMVVRYVFEPSVTN